MTKIYLLIWVWIAFGHQGGPSVSVQEMPNFVICEKLGTKAKSIFNEKYSEKWRNDYNDYFIDYQCIEIKEKDDKQTICPK
jgi:hypothetical protein